MSSYKLLNRQKYSYKEYSIVPIRHEDRYLIMQWRNEQIYHLRQISPLTEEDQDKYFNTVVSNLFEQEEPQQLLFSYLKNDICIGYGGLVHINWMDKNAEISFIMETSLEEEHFEKHWRIYLSLVEQVAFDELFLHKIYTYAFDLRPNLYVVMEKSGFEREAVLKEHCFYNGEYRSVVIHSKRRRLQLRKARETDLDITFSWANDPHVRAFSYNKSNIDFNEHAQWFLSKLKSDRYAYYILELKSCPIGSIRFDIEKENTAKISYLIDSKYVGKGLGTHILKEGINLFKELNPEVDSVYGYVLRENRASIKIFEKEGYRVDFENQKEMKFIKLL